MTKRELENLITQSINIYAKERDLEIASGKIKLSGFNEDGPYYVVHLKI